MEAGAGGMGSGPFKPEVFASYGNGWRQLWRHFGWLLLIGIIYYAITFAVSIPQYIGQLASANSNMGLSVFGVVWSLVTVAFSVFIGGPLAYGIYYAFLKAARGERVEVGDMFAAFKNYWTAVAAGLVVGIIVAVATVFFIVPGIYFFCKLAFIPYLVVDKKMGFGEAFGESWRMAGQGRAWKVFLVGLLGIPITIVGFICLGVGVIIASMWIYAAFASLFYAIDAGRGPAVGAPLPVNP
jgi:hypothetical protein